MPRLQLGLLGPLSLGHPAFSDLRSSKAVALLVYLAVEAAFGRPVQQRERLMALFWPDSPPASAQVNLRGVIYQLRRILAKVGAAGEEGAPFLVSDRRTVALHPDAGYELDVAAFLQLLENPADVDALAEAVALYRADFLTDFYLPDSEPFEEWAAAHRAQFHQQALDTLQRLADLRLQQGRYAEAEAYARRQLELDNLRESAYRQLMVALDRTGQRAAALRECEKCRALLASELDVELSTETQQLAEQLRAGARPALYGSSFVNHSAPPKLTLPVPPNPLIGRETELERLEHLLSNGCRIISVVGPGGVGKSRFALEAAHRLSGRFGDGAAVVNLAPSQSAEDVIAAIAQTLRVTLHGSGESRDLRTQLLDYLRERHLLLVLDDFEHLLDAASLATGIVQAAPQVTLLVTSRERLRLQAEHVFPLHGLPLTRSESMGEANADPAIRLFVYHAQRQQRSFMLRREDLQPLATINRLVSGLPLALILAAAWTELMTPAAIAAELAESLDFLEVADRDLPERQRSMRAVLDGTWQCLSKREQTILAALSVFRGTFTLDAAQAVIRAEPQDLRRLVGRSLLVAGDHASFELHELLCRFASEQLARDPAAEQTARERHSHYYSAFLGQRELKLKGVQSLEAEADIANAFANVRQAWNWAVHHSERHVNQAQTALGLFYERQGRWQEGEVAFLYAEDNLAGQETTDPKRRAERLVWGSHFVRLRSPELAEAMMERALDCLYRAAMGEDDIRAERAFALLIQSQLYGHPTDTRVRLLEESLRLYQELDSLWNMAWVHKELAWLYMKEARYRAAQEQYRQVRRLRENVGDQRLALRATIEIATNMAWMGQLVGAEAELHEALAMCTATGDELGAVRARWRLGEVLLFSGRFKQTLESVARSREDGVSRGHELLITLSDLYRCWALLHLGQYSEADRDLERTMSNGRVTGYYRALGLFLQGSLALVHTRLDDARRHFQESLTILHATEQPDEAGWTQAGLGYVAVGSGDYGSAQKHLADAIRLRLFVPAMLALPAAACLFAQTGTPVHAIEVYRLARTFAFVANSRWFADVAGRKIDTACATISPEEVATAQSRGQTQDFWETLDVLLLPLEQR
jgi:predicted ATPase/DNA-binding SARP family transcriptional activator